MDGEHTTKTGSSIPRKRNAFSELMTAKPKQSKASPSTTKTATHTPPVNHFSLGLIPYVEHPENYPDLVVLYDENTVLVKDKFPKATVHLLLLARDPTFHRLTPIDAFSSQHDPDGRFLKLMKEEADNARKLAASELKRLLGAESRLESARRETQERLAQADVTETDDVPEGRDWLSEIKVGVHAEPSMATLHIHIISKDMVSEKLKHKKHYNSFNSDFFVSLDEFPLTQADKRNDKKYRESLLGRDMSCWRCGQDFGNKFAQLRTHLLTEYEEWRRI